MTDFDTLQNMLWASVLAKLGGVDAAFTSLTGVPSSIKVVFAESMQLQPSGLTQTWLQVKTIEYSLADLNREAMVGESFKIRGMRYFVQSIMNNDGYVVKAVVSE
jgi:hypothetical protein